MNVDLGENWAILGANGTGKSSLLRLLSGIDAPLKGRVLVDGVEMRTFSKKSLARQIGLLPQIEEDQYWGSVGGICGFRPFFSCGRAMGQI